MAITVNWVTRVVSVPRADMTLVQASPEIRELDIDAFRLEVRALEASEEGIVNPGEFALPDGIVANIAPITFGSTTLARVVQLINGYTVEFEAGVYNVEIVGGNSNLGSNKVPNTTSVATNNSGGLVEGAGAAAVWERELETGYTAEEILRICAAVLAGKVSGAGTGTELFRNVSDEKVRFTSIVDANGNRISTTLDGT